MCLEGPDDLQGLGEDPNVSISASKEEILRARTNTTKVVALSWSVKIKRLTAVFALTSKASPSSVGFISATSKKLKVFH